MQYFCLHGILPFSKSYPEIESTWPTGKCRGRKSFDTWYYIVTCAKLCVRFSSKSKATNVFRKHIVKSKASEQSIPARKKSFCHVTVKNYLCNVSWKFLIKIESRWRREIKEQAPHLTLLYHGRTVRSSHRRCCVRKLFLKILQYPQETSVLESIFKNVTDLCNFIKKRHQHRCFPENIAKFLILPILKKICKRLLNNFFNDSLLHEPKDLSWLLPSWSKSQPAFKNLRQNTFDKSIKFYYWLFLAVLDDFRSF